MSVGVLAAAGAPCFGTVVCVGCGGSGVAFAFASCFGSSCMTVGLVEGMFVDVATFEFEFERDGGAVDVGVGGGENIAIGGTQEESNCLATLMTR